MCRPDELFEETVSLLNDLIVEPKKEVQKKIKSEITTKVFPSIGFARCTKESIRFHMSKQKTRMFK